jgi:hypothetical protein
LHITFGFGNLNERVLETRRKEFWKPEGKSFGNLKERVLET